MKIAPLCAYAIAGALFAVSAPAADYYVSSSDASRNDGGPGSQSQPWETVAKVNATVFSPGDTIHFKSGDTWRERLVASSSGSSVGTITYSAYGTGAKPVISGAEIVTGWTLHTTGTANTYYATLAPSTVMVTADDTYLKKGASKDALSANQYRYESGVLYVNIGADPASHLIEAAQRDNAAYISAGKNYITIDGLRLEKTNLANVTIDNCSYPTVKNCELFFSNCNTTFSGGGINADRSHYALYQGNHINYALGDAVMSWRGHDVTVADNYIENIPDDGEYAGADGIQLGSKAGTSYNCDNYRIINNTIIRSSDSTNKGCIIAEYGDNGLISGNTCYKGRFGIAPSGDNVTVSCNYVTGFGNGGGIRVTEDTPNDGIKILYNIISESGGFSGIQISNDTSGHAENRSNFQIHNNVIYNTYYGISIGQPFSGSIKNNIVWGRHTNPRNRLSLGTVIAGQAVDIDHNIYQDKGTESLIYYSGTSYYDLASWQSATGFDTHSSTADPEWINPTEGDFHLKSISPAIDAGTDVGMASDFGGHAVPQGSAPEIGPIEYGGLYAYEGFDYGTGSVSGANGGQGWGSAWEMSGGGGGNDVISGSLSYADLPGAGNKLRLYDTDGVNQGASRSLANVMGVVDETYWISFLAKKNSSAREAYGYFGGLTFRAYQGNNWDFKTTNTSYSTLAGADYGTRHLFLVRVDATLTGDTVRVWVDPDLSAGEPSLASATATKTDSSGFTFGTLTIKHGPWGNSSQSGEWDEFRIGSNFKSVAGTTVGQVTDLSAEADAYVQSGTSANTNFGTVTNLMVKYETPASNYNREGLIRFDLSSYTRSLDEAELVLTPVGVGTDIASSSFQVKLVSDDTWTEGGVTWNNKPSGGTVLGTISGSAIAVGQPILINLNAAVAQELAGDGKLSVVIVSTVAGAQRYLQFGSRESGADAPVLRLQ